MRLVGILERAPAEVRPKGATSKRATLEPIEHLTSLGRVQDHPLGLEKLEAPLYLDGLCEAEI